MSKAEYSPRFELVKRYFNRGLWNKARVEKAVDCGWITETEKAEILGKEK